MVPFVRQEQCLQQFRREGKAAFLKKRARPARPPNRENAAAYIANWLQALRNDKKLVVMAGAQAQKAVDHILGRAFEGELEARAA